MRIAMMGHKRVPSREGGIEIVVEELGARMAALGHQVTVYNRTGHHVSGRHLDTERRSCYRGMRLRYVPTIDRKGFAALTSAFFSALCCAFGPYDIVHIHAEGPAIMTWLPRLLGKRVVVTIHGLDHRRAKWGRLGRTSILLGERCAVLFANEIIVLSQGVQRYFQQQYRRTTELLYNGVTPPCFRPPRLIREMFQLEKDGYLLYLGRIVPEKGLTRLVDAFCRLTTDKRLVIAGGASDSSGYIATLEKAASRDPRILFTGFVQGELLEELYSNAYFYVLPSDLEGMPLSLLEAMSYGNCCLTSDIEENTQVTGPWGVTFRTGDTDDLYAKLRMLCEDPSQVERCRAGASDYVLTRHSWDEATRRTLAVYERAMQS